MIELISPKNNERLCLIKENAKRFFDDYKLNQLLIKNDYKFNGVNWNTEKQILVTKYINKNRFIYKPILFSFILKHKSKLLISTNKNFSDHLLQKVTSKNQLKIFNLLRNQKYYWKIIDMVTLEESETRTFITMDYPRIIKAGKLINVRDFGGYSTKHGKRIRQNLLLRGPELVLENYQVYNKVKEGIQTHNHEKTITKNGLNELRKILNNTIEVDLRAKNEANFINKSPLTTKSKVVSYISFDYGIESYDYFFNLTDESKKTYNKIFEAIAQCDKKQVYLHCWGGADRTGTICFLLGALLGMSYTDLVIEYELTSFGRNIRKHYDLNPPSVWLRFPQFIEWLEAYAKDNGMYSKDMNEIVEHLLINYIGISKKTILKIKNIFLV